MLLILRREFEVENEVVEHALPVCEFRQLGVDVGDVLQRRAVPAKRGAFREQRLEPGAELVALGLRSRQPLRCGQLIRRRRL